MERVVGREGGVTGDKGEKKRKEWEAEKGRGEWGDKAEGREKSCIKIKWNTIYQCEKEVNVPCSRGAGGNSSPFFTLPREFSQTLPYSLPLSLYTSFICSPSLSFFPSSQSLLFPWRPCEEFQLEELAPPPPPPPSRLIAMNRIGRKREKRGSESMWQKKEKSKLRNSGKKNRR